MKVLPFDTLLVGMLGCARLTGRIPLGGCGVGRRVFRRVDRDDFRWSVGFLGGFFDNDLAATHGFERSHGRDTGLNEEQLYPNLPQSRP